jgi:gliding motility-associated-like protein
MKRFLPIIFLPLLLIMCYQDAKASHDMGADLQYTCLGNNQYRVRLSFYRDCSGISANPSFPLEITSPSGCHGPLASVQLNLVSGYSCPNGTKAGALGCEVSPICPSQLSDTKCNNPTGRFPGVQQYIYEGIITLPSECADWRISFSDNARNTSNNITTSGSDNLTVVAFINNTTDPNSVFSGLDSVVYRTCDNGAPQLCDTAIAYLNVGNTKNYPPVIARTTTTAIPGSPIRICAFISDPNPFNVVAFNQFTCFPFQGSVQPNPSVSFVNGVGTVCFDYLPLNNAVGADSFCFKVCDNTGLCSTSSIRIDLNTPPNTPPLAVNDTFTLIAGDSLIGYTPLVNDYDNNYWQILILNTAPVTNAAGGTVTINSLGQIRYVPNLGFFGIDSFKYSICDNAGVPLCDTATVYFGVLPPNNYAPIAGSRTVTVLNDTLNNICIAVADANRGDSISLGTVLHTPAGTTVSNITVNNASFPVKVCFDINANAAIGFDSLTFTVCDKNLLCDTARVFFNISPKPNRVPVAKEDIYQIPVNSPYNGASVSINDTDPNAGQSLTTTVIKAPGHGTFTMNPNGTFSYTPPVPYKLCNSSPQFTNLPTPFYCINSGIFYNQGSVDAEGDSLIYELVNPLGSASGTGFSNIPFSNGYSVTQPISTANGVKFDRTTGQMTFTPNKTEADVLAIRVSEYRKGVLIGTTMRDMQVQIIDCVVSIPTGDPATYTNINNANREDSITLSICPNSTATIDIPFYDRGNKNITIKSNIQGSPSPLPGATLTAVTVGTGARDTVLARITWTPSDTIKGCRFFVVTAENDDCPIKGSYTKAYRFCVVDKIKIVPSGTVYCGGTPISLTPSGGTVFDWSPGAGLNDSTIKSPLATPTTTTWYKLVTDCGTDSVRINVAQPFAYDAGLGGAICQNGQLQLNASVANTFAPYTIKWTPSSGLVDPVLGNPTSNILNPVASPLVTTKYLVSFTGTNGCTNIDSVQVNVNGFAPRLTATANKSIVCPGEDVRLSVTSSPQSCGLATGPCDGIDKQVTVGTGVNYSSNSLVQYPSPFGNYNKNSRQQYLYKAADVIAVTGTGGTIQTIAFDMKGAGGAVNNLTVKIGCTSVDSLTGYENAGLSTVYSPKTYTSTIGWNILTLDFPYEWDGISNLVIDVCNSNTNYTNGNTQARMTKTLYRSVYASASGAFDQCGITGTPVVGNALKPYELPNIKMDICLPDLSKFNIAWTPNSGANAPAPLNKDTVHAQPKTPQIYQVEVSDSTGCKSNDFVYVNVDTTTTLTFNNDTFICSANASVVLKASIKSTLPANSFTYSWAAVPNAGFNPGNVSQVTVSPSATTKYYVTVTGGACPLVDSMTFTTGSNLPVTFNYKDVSCFGKNDGFLKVRTNGGIAPLSYSWVPATYSGDSISNLAPGVYTVKVVDAQGCEGTASDTIKEPAVLQLNFSLLNITCNRAANGNITATVVGGTPTYTYTWSPNISSSASASSLDTGAYNLTVTDSKGCTITESRTLTEPAGMTLTVITNDASTNGGADGTATVNIIGGTAPFTYLWSNTATTQNIANLDSGNYCVTVTDSKGCTKAGCGLVDNPPPIFLSFVNVNVTCPGGNNGSSTVSVSGGTAPYRYVWSTGNLADTLASVGNLKAGSYMVTVTDSSGVQVSKTIAISEPLVIALTIDTTPVSCTGGNNGAVLAIPSGGTAPFTFAWQSPLSATTQAVTNLSAGTYTVIATDQKGCKDTASATLADPEPLVATIIIAIGDVKCFGGSDGTATVSITGGTPAYTYAWSNSTQTSATVNDLAAGPGTVTVTDSRGCYDTAGYTLTQPALLAVAAIPVSASCATSIDGSATAQATGGTSPYKYQWDGAQGIDNINMLDTGIHTIVVTDQNSCTATATFNIDTVYALRINITTTDALCFGSNNGTVTVAPVNGTPYYNYNYLSSLNNTVYDPNTLQAGNYTVTATDSRNCNAEGAFTIGQPKEIILDFGMQDPLCFNDNNGKAWVTASGGTPGYTYDWAPDASLTDTLGNVPAGTYQVVVTDATGCTRLGNVLLNNPTQLLADIINKAEITCANNVDGKAELQATGGTPPYAYLWSNQFSAPQLTNAGPGTYTATVTDVNTCSATASVTFVAPPLITFSLAQGDSVSCPGYTDGMVEVLGSGGTPGSLVQYSYAIDNGAFQNIGTFNDLAAGSYIVKIRDSNNCEADTVVVVGQPVPLVLSVLPNDTTLELGEQIKLYSFIQGYQPDQVQAYIWQPSTGLSCSDCASPVVSVFNDEDYTLTVKYRNKCSASAQVSILVNEGPEFFIPNMFSPNGDGDNDTWEIYGSGLREVQAKIFNRWGEKVFDSIGNQFTSWDGTYKGKELDTDVYVYYVKVIYLNGKVKEKTGSITLVN